MANFSITVVNTLDFFGPSQPTKWNAFLWNAARWGQDADLGTIVTKVIDSTATPTSDPVKYIKHCVDDEGFAFDSDIVKFYVMTIDESLDLVADMYSETLREPNGYYYLYADRVSDAENRAIPTYSSGTAASVTWSPGAAQSTSWS